MNLTISPIPVNYYGHLQGYKIFINGTKYPRTSGFYYATSDKDHAIKIALQDKKTEDQK